MMSGHTGNTPPPPSYDEALRHESRAASDPLLGPTGSRPRSHPSASNYQTSYSTGRPGGEAEYGDLDISDSPHSSDDEETACLKADLRRLREEQLKNLPRTRAEEKKQRLREALQRVEGASMGASGRTTGYGEVIPHSGFGASHPQPAGYFSPTAPAQPQYGQIGAYYPDQAALTVQPPQPAPYPSGAHGATHGVVIHAPTSGSQSAAAQPSGSMQGPISCTGLRYMQEQELRDGEKDTGCTKCCFAIMFVVIFVVVGLIIALN